MGLSACFLCRCSFDLHSPFCWKFRCSPWKSDEQPRTEDDRKGRKRKKNKKEMREKSAENRGEGETKETDSDA